MNDLARMQTWMQQVLCHPGGVREGLRSEGARALDPDAIHDLEHTITASRGMSALERLEVYARLLDGTAQTALDRMYPGVRVALGPEAFGRLVREHRRRRPSSVRRIQAWGLDFALTLAECLDDPICAAPPRAGEDPAPRSFVVELAELEAALHRLQWAPWVEPLDPGVLRELPPERLLAGRFRCVASMELRRLRHPIATFLRHALDAGQRAPIGTEPEFALLSHVDGRAHVIPLAPRPGELLKLLIEGRRLGEALETLLARDDGVASELEAGLAGWFESWGSARIFAAFEEQTDG